MLKIAIMLFGVRLFLGFLDSIKGPGWTRCGESLVNVNENAQALEEGDPKHFGEGRPVRVSLIRDGESWMIIGVDDMSSCRVKRAAINTCPLLKLVSMFAPSVRQWVIDQNAADHEGEGGCAREGVDERFDLERELPTEVRIRCGYPEWRDDYEGGPFLISHNASTFRSPAPRYSAKSFPFRTTWVRNEFGVWKQLETWVWWENLEDSKAPFPDGEANMFRRERELEVAQR